MRLLERLLLALALSCLSNAYAGTAAADPFTISLWEDGAPGGPTKPQDEPVVFLWRPPADVATRAAVVVCPGGGYGHLALEKEGSRIAEWLNSFGVTAFVLRYRHAGTGHRHPV